MTTLRTRLALIGALALAARLVVVAATVGYRPIHDDASYARVARWLLVAGHYPGHDVPGGGWQISAYRPPGWPATLWGAWELLGSGLTGVRVVEAVVGALVAVLVAALAGEVFGAAAALGAGVVAALSPLALAVGASLESETLFTALVLAATWASLAARRTGAWRWLPVVGVLAGLAALTRTNGLVVVLVLALVAATAAGRWRERAARGAVPLVVAALVVAPWTMRNAVELHAFVPVSTEVGNTLAGTYNPVSARHGAQWLDPQRTGAYRAVYRRYGASAAADAALTRAVLRWVGRHPGYPFVVAARNGARLLGLTGAAWAAFSLRTMSLGDDAAALVWLGVLATTLLAAAGLWLGRASTSARLLWAVLAALWLPAALVNGELRLGAPAAALMSVFAGLALAGAAQRTRAVRATVWSSRADSRPASTHAKRKQSPAPR